MRTTMKMREEEFDNYINFLNERAWSFHHSTGLDFGELQAYTYLSFCESLNRYDSTQGASLITFLYWKVTNDLRTYTSKEYKWMEMIELDELLYLPFYQNESVESAINLSQLVSSLSSEAQGVVEIILSCPEELTALVKSHAPRKLKGAIQKYLKKLGWRYNKINSVMKEIETRVVYYL